MLRLFAVLASATIAACGGSAPQGETTPDERPRLTVALRFEEAPDRDGDPTTQVVLVAIHPDRDTQTVAIDRATGACHFIRPDDQALLAAECAWGPIETRIWVEHHGDELVAVRVGRGEMPREVARLTVPRDAAIEVLQPDTLPVR